MQQENILFFFLTQKLSLHFVFGYMLKFEFLQNYNAEHTVYMKWTTYWLSTIVEVNRYSIQGGYVNN